MPIIIFEGPALEVDRKRELIRSLTDAAAGATGYLFASAKSPTKVYFSRPALHGPARLRR